MLWREILLTPPTSADPTRNRYWDVVNAYDARDMCEKALKPEEERRKRQLDDIKKETTEGKTIQAVPLKVVCLLDTVDPRGPKGK